VTIEADPGLGTGTGAKGNQIRKKETAAVEARGATKDLKAR
jgi:hypothetical protein